MQVIVLVVVGAHSKIIGFADPTFRIGNGRLQLVLKVPFRTVGDVTVITCRTGIDTCTKICSGPRLAVDAVVPIDKIASVLRKIGISFEIAFGGLNTKIYTSVEFVAPAISGCNGR